MHSDTESTIKISISGPISVELSREDIDKAKRALWGMAQDDYLEQYAIDALLQAGIGTGGHPITDSDWQKAFTQEITARNACAPEENAYPTFASSRLLDAVRWEFDPKSQRAIIQAAEASKRGEVVQAFDVQSQPAQREAAKIDRAETVPSTAGAAGNLASNAPLFYDKSSISAKESAPESVSESVIFAGSPPVMESLEGTTMDVEALCPLRPE